MNSLKSLRYNSIREAITHQNPTKSSSLCPLYFYNQRRWLKPVDSAQTRLENRTRDHQLDKLITQIRKLNIILEISKLMSYKKRGPFVSLQLMSRWKNLVGLNIKFGAFVNIFDPFTPTRSLSQVLNFMDQFSESPLVAATRGMAGGSGVRRGWDVKEKDDALHLRIDMPGLSREDVKLALEQNTLVIKGEGKTEEEEIDVSGDGRRFTSRIGLPEKVYKTDEIKAEMKNGVLKVVIPKIKEEERNNVRHINVD